MRKKTIHNSQFTIHNSQFLILLPVIWILLGCAGLPVSLLPTPTPFPKPQVRVVADGLLNPVGMAALPDGSLLVAEEGTGDQDDSAGLTLITSLHPPSRGDRGGWRVGRLISGLPSRRDAGDLAGVPAVALAPGGDKIYLGNFGPGHLWTLPLTLEQQVSGLDLLDTPLTTANLTPAMLPLNNVRLTNPFDITFDAAGVPVVTDASGNGVAKQNPDGTIRFIHRFAGLPNPATANGKDTIEAVPTGITRIGNEYYVTLTGGCPYPEGGGQLVAIDENRNQRTVVAGLNMPIDVAAGSDGTVWVLEFARFTPDASCFTGEGYQAHTGRLSRLLPDGTLAPVLTELNFPGAVLPMPDGSLYVSEVLAGRILHVTFRSEQLAVNSEQLAVSGRQSSIVNQLRDVAVEVGLDFRQGAFRTGVFMDPVAAMGGGLCWIDYNNDGWLDLYLVNSHAEAEMDFWERHGGLPRNALYHNDAGKFTEVSAETGTDLAMRGNGCVAADFNVDGWWDIYITADGPNALLWNNGDGTFTEGAAEAGVATPEWNSAAVVGDLNHDGLPDLYVAAYIDLNRKVPKPLGLFPQDYYGLPDRLYLNTGRGPRIADRGSRIADRGSSIVNPTAFREVTEAAGLLREERGLGALFSDLDLDGDLDLYIANDGHPNRLYANEPWPGGVSADPEGLGFRLVDLTDTANAGDSGSGMGVAGGDYDGDGMTDLFITNWERELNALYRNETTEEGHLTFQYSTFRIGIMGLGSNMTGWGTAFVDLDHDTDLDLLTINSRVPVTDLETDRQLVRFYRNRTWNLEGGQGRPGLVQDRPGQFIEATEPVGLKEFGPLMGRGSAVADYDNDGDLDVAINTIAGHVVLLRNDGDHGNWLQVGLDGFYPGALITVELPDGRRLMRELYAGSSYLASEDPRLHFGLGPYDVVPRLTVRWPDGRQLTLSDVPANQRLILPP